MSWGLLDNLVVQTLDSHVENKVISLFDSHFSLRGELLHVVLSLAHNISLSLFRDDCLFAGESSTLLEGFLI